MPIDTQKLEEVAREELRLLWKDLADARSYSVNGAWSIRCDELVERINALTTLVGPTPWDEISIPLLEAGIYQRVHADLGIPVEVDMERAMRAKASMEQRGAW